jgi:hypothetical protein
MKFNIYLDQQPKELSNLVIAAYATLSSLLLRYAKIETPSSMLLKPKHVSHIHRMTTPTQRQ